MKKIIMLIAVLLMPFTFSYAEEVSIPAIWNKQMISAKLYTTYSEDFYQYDNWRFSYHAFVPACVTSANVCVVSNLHPVYRGVLFGIRFNC